MLMDCRRRPFGQATWGSHSRLVAPYMTSWRKSWMIPSVPGRECRRHRTIHLICPRIAGLPKAVAWGKIRLGNRHERSWTDSRITFRSGDAWHRGDKGSDDAGRTGAGFKGNPVTMGESHRLTSSRRMKMATPLERIQSQLGNGRAAGFTREVELLAAEGTSRQTPGELHWKDCCRPSGPPG